MFRSTSRLVLRESERNVDVGRDDTVSQSVKVVSPSRLDFLEINADTPTHAPRHTMSVHERVQIGQRVNCALVCVRSNKTLAAIIETIQCRGKTVFNRRLGRKLCLLEIFRAHTPVTGVKVNVSDEGAKEIDEKKKKKRFITIIGCKRSGEDQVGCRQYYQHQWQHKTMTRRKVWPRCKYLRC